MLETYAVQLPKLCCLCVGRQKDASFLQTYLYFNKKELGSRDVFAVAFWALLSSSDVHVMQLGARLPTFPEIQGEFYLPCAISKRCQ